MSGRLPPHPAQRTDPSRPLSFTFAGRPIPAFAGDTIGAALHAAGVRVLSRSARYHRPRGLLCCAGRCPNCVVTVDGIPNVRACTEPVRDGLRVAAPSAWPSLEHDLFAVWDHLHRLLPSGVSRGRVPRLRGLWPARGVGRRRRARLGEGGEPAAGGYEREHVFADVVVAGGGPAGIAAALEAARAGAHVLLVDDQPRLGGHLLVRTRPLAGGEFDGRPGWEVAAELAAAVAGEARIRVLGDATAFGLYEGGLVGVLQGGRRLVTLRAGQVVVATGGVEHPLVFQGNDRPGVLLASGAQRLAALYGVRPGARAVVAAVDDRGLEAALDLVAAGVELAAVLDARPTTPDSPPAAELRRAGVGIANGRTVLEARGGRRVTAAVVGGAARDEGAREVACDLLCLATGFEPAAGLLGQAGARLRPDALTGRLVPADLPPGVHGAGEVMGVEGLDAILLAGRLAGAEAVLALVGGARLAGRAAELRDALAARRTPAGLRVALARAVRRGARKLVCLCEDVTERELARAVAEGFDHIEMLKRATAVTMGACQGQMCHRAAVDLCAALTRRPLEATGTTTARPPLVPVPLGALAARRPEPVRRTPMHERHLALGATLVEVGGWTRPLAYTTVDEECRAVHEAVGLIDASPLGKLEVVGRDAAALLEWLHAGRVADLVPGRIRYRVLCDEAGVILDDGIVACLGADRFLLTTTTGGAEAIEQWLTWWLAGAGRCAHVTNVTGARAAVTVAGPRARELLGPLAEVDLAPAAFPYLGAREGRVAGIPALLLRTGSVGELGYEVHVPAECGASLWDALLEAGRPLRARPFGVGAERVLRLEKRHAAVGHDLDGLATPIEAGLAWAVERDKPDFVGRAALRAAEARGAGRRLVGFVLDGPGAMPEDGAAVVAGGRAVGRVTSVRWSVQLGRGVGLAWVPAELAREGGALWVRVDGGTRPATVVAGAFYDPEGARLRS